MALYKYSAYLTATTEGAFDKVNSASATALDSGIYRCEGCGREVSSTAGHPLPPENHHQHSPYQGKIRWRLVTRADHQPK